MDEARDTFSEAVLLTDGIGPVFNNTSCVSCHQAPFGQVGTGSQITELRAGHFDGVNFVDHPGGSLINDRANDRPYGRTHRRPGSHRGPWLSSMAVTRPTT